MTLIENGFSEFIAWQQTGKFSASYTLWPSSFQAWSYATSALRFTALSPWGQYRIHLQDANSCFKILRKSVLLKNLTLTLCTLLTASYSMFPRPALTTLNFLVLVIDSLCILRNLPSTLEPVLLSGSY